MQSRENREDKQEAHSPPEWLSSRRAGQIPQVSLSAGFALGLAEDNSEAVKVQPNAD